MTFLAMLRALRSKLLGCNLHEVDPGKVYRVARGKLDDAPFAELLRRLGIRTAVDLRRASAADGPGGPVDFAALGIRYENVHLRSSVLVLPECLSRFVEILDGAEPPLLLYCKRGTDKSGFASMLALMLRNGVPLDAARAQLAFIPFGHKKHRHGGPWHFIRLLRETGPHSDLRYWIRGSYPALFEREMRAAGDVRT